MIPPSARAIAITSVGAVRDDPGGRLALMRGHYRVPPDVDRGYLPFRQAASAFMRWQLRRGLLNPIDSPTPGSPWWRAINERLLDDVGDARALAFGYPGPPSSLAVAAWLEFIRHPRAASWYRAHNVSVVGAYLEHEHLAASEDRIERFFINLVLLRVLYTQAVRIGWRSEIGVSCASRSRRRTCWSE